MSRKITSSLNTAHFFWSFPNGMAWTIWFSNRNFRFSQVNGKYPSTSIPARTNSQRDRGHKISEEKGPLLLHYLLQLKMVRSSNLLYRKRKTVSQLWHLSGARLCVKGALTNSPYVRLEPYVWRFLAPSTFRSTALTTVALSLWCNHFILPTLVSCGWERTTRDVTLSR